MRDVIARNPNVAEFGQALSGAWDGEPASGRDGKGGRGTTTVAEVLRDGRALDRSGQQLQLRDLSAEGSVFLYTVVHRRGVRRRGITA